MPCASRECYFVQSSEKRESVAPLKRIARIETNRTRHLERLPVCYRSCRRAVSVNPVRPHAEHCNPPPRNSLHTGKHKRRIPPPHPISRDRGTQFAVGNQRDAPPRV